MNCPSLVLNMINREDRGLSEALAATHASIAARPLSCLAGGHLTHDEVAAMVRMLSRHDIAHEAACNIARDRIVWLAAQLAEAEQALAQERGKHAALAQRTDSAAELTDERFKRYGVIMGRMLFTDCEDGAPLRAALDAYRKDIMAALEAWTVKRIGFTSEGNLELLAGGFRVAVHPSQTPGHAVEVFTAQGAQ